MRGYLSYLELQDNTRLTFLVEEDDPDGIFRFRRNDDRAKPLSMVKHDILDRLGPVAHDEEIIATFTKRKKA